MFPFRRVPGGLELFIRLSPKSATNTLSGIYVTQDKVFIKAQVRAVPEDGRANKALTELLADTFRVPKTTLSLASGHTARLKTIKYEGDGAAMETAVRAWLERQK